MYEPLTRTIMNESGQLVAVCKFYGTEQCRMIHKTPNDCNIRCPMIAAIIEQLNAFEEVYLSADEGEQ